MADSEQTTTTPEAMRDAVISMAVESWRFGRVFDRLLLKLDAGEQNRYKSQFRWFIKKVEEASNMVARGNAPAAKAELLGAIVYSAAAYLLIEESEQ